MLVLVIVYALYENGIVIWSGVRGAYHSQLLMNAMDVPIFQVDLNS